MSEASPTCYPVDSDALHPANAISDHVLSPGLISLGPANGAQTHVHPVDCVIVWENKDRTFLYPFTVTQTFKAVISATSK